MGLGEISLGEMGLGEMGLGEMGQNPRNYRVTLNMTVQTGQVVKPLTTRHTEQLMLLSVWIRTDKSSTSGLLSVWIGTAEPRCRLCVHIPHYPHPNPNPNPISNPKSYPNLKLFNVTNKHQYTQANMSAS